MHSVWHRTRALIGHEQRRRQVTLVIVGLSFALLGVGIVQRWQEVRTYAWRLEGWSLLLSEAAYLAAQGVTILAWTILARTLRLNSTWKQDAKFFIYSWMARRLPTAAPYLATRVLLYEEIGVPKRVTSLGLLWENVLVVAAGVLLAIFLLPFTPLIRQQYVQTLVIIAALASLAIVLVPSSLGHFTNLVLRWLGKEPLPFFVNKRMASLLLCLYLVVWLAGGLLLFWLIRAIHPIPWNALPLVMQGWVLSGLVSYLVFFAPLGFGLREVTLVSLLSTVIPVPVAIAVALLARLWLMINEMVWSLLALKA
jgi:glycosyltransferase 2 family protein